MCIIPSSHFSLCIASLKPFDLFACLFGVLHLAAL